MTLPVLVADALDDDRPKRPDPLEDSLCSAQQRRYLKTCSGSIEVFDKPLLSVLNYIQSCINSLKIN